MTALYREALAAVDRGEVVALATVVSTRRSVPRRPGSKMVIYGDGRTSGTVGGGEMESRVIAAALESLRTGIAIKLSYELLDPGVGDPGVCGGEVEIYVEPLSPDATIYVIGCGHVGRAVIDLAHWMGFRVVAADDRAELVTADLLPHADVRCAGPIADVVASAPITSNTDVVLVTRNVGVDLEILPVILASSARSVGVMGSKRRFATTVERLKERGSTLEQLARLRSPIGLEIAAETPREIAVSIMAEIVQSRRASAT